MSGCARKRRWRSHAGSLVATLATVLAAVTACGSNTPPAGMGRVEGQLTVHKAALRSHPGRLIVHFSRRGLFSVGESALDSTGHFEVEGLPGTYRVTVLTHAGPNLQGGTPAGPTCPSTIRLTKNQTTQVSLSWPAGNCGSNVGKDGRSVDR